MVLITSVTFFLLKMRILEETLRHRAAVLPSGPSTSAGSYPFTRCCSEPAFPSGRKLLFQTESATRRRLGLLGAFRSSRVTQAHPSCAGSFACAFCPGVCHPQTRGSASRLLREQEHRRAGGLSHVPVTSGPTPCGLGPSQDGKGTGTESRGKKPASGGTPSHPSRSMAPAPGSLTLALKTRHLYEREHQDCKTWDLSK